MIIVSVVCLTYNHAPYIRQCLDGFVMQKTNFRYVVRADIQDDLDFASVDVSFISLSKILGPAWALLKDGGQMVCLIKPQFEAGRDKVGKKGVVREPEMSLRHTVK